MFDFHVSRRKQAYSRINGHTVRRTHSMTQKFKKIIPFRMKVCAAVFMIAKLEDNMLVYWKVEV